MQFENGNIKGPAAEIVDSNNAVLLFVEPIGERSRSGFIHQTQNFESGDATCVLCGLPLRIIEICRNRNDGFCYGFAKEAFGVAFQLAKDKCRNFRRSESLLSE